MLSSTADTNVFISGLHFGGLPRRFLNLAEAGALRLTVSKDILIEVTKVLAYEKLGWPPEQIEKATRQLGRFTGRVQPRETLHVITTDPSDNRVLECVVAANSQYPVTGDHHLLDLQQYR